MKKNFINEKQRKEIVERRKKGEKISDLAKSYGCTTSTIIYHWQRSGNSSGAYTKEYRNNERRSYAAGIFKRKKEDKKRCGVCGILSKIPTCDYCNNRSKK